MTCPYATAFTPLPVRSRVVLLVDGAHGTIAGYDHPGLFPRAETVRYAVNRDDGSSTFARHDELAPTTGPLLRLIASDGQRVNHDRSSVR